MGSVREWATYFFDRFGPPVTARAMLGERLAELGEKLVAVFEKRNEANDGSPRMPQEYLLSVVRV
jgi:hypothetical protein